jgi:CHC2 zinc finger/Toprim domain
MNRPLDRDLIERAHQVDILAVAQRYAKLQRDGGRNSKEFAGPCPICGGEDRFAVNTKKQKWNCRGCDEGGDVIALIEHITGRTFIEAIELLTGQQWPQRQITERAQRDRTGAASSDHRPLALRIWNESEPLFATPAEVYLHARSIDLDEIPDIDDVLRFHAECPFGKQRLRCLVALIRDAKTDAPIGIMRTALDEHGRKIERMALGDKAGGAIKLWSDAAISTGLVVGEGLETVAAAATRIEDRGTKLQPAWALIDAGNLRHFPPPPGIEHLTILVDNDPADRRGHHPGQDAAAACVAVWLKAGRYVTELTPEVEGSDFADIAAQDTEPRQ